MFKKKPEQYLPTSYGLRMDHLNRNPPEYVPELTSEDPSNIHDCWKMHCTHRNSITTHLHTAAFRIRCWLAGREVIHHAYDHGYSDGRDVEHSIHDLGGANCTAGSWNHWWAVEALADR